MGAPVVYVSPALHIDIAPYITAEFAVADVVVLPKLEGELAEIEGRIVSGGMEVYIHGQDYVALEKMMDEHVAEGKKPLMVVGVVGSSILGQNDMISKILEVRKNKQHTFWLHVVGQVSIRDIYTIYISIGCICIGIERAKQCDGTCTYAGRQFHSTTLTVVGYSGCTYCGMFIDGCMYMTCVRRCTNQWKDTRHRIEINWIPYRGGWRRVI